MGDTASTLTVNSLASTATTLSMSMTLSPSYAYDMMSTYRFMYWTFSFHNFNLPLTWTSVSVIITFPNGVLADVTPCMSFFSIHEFRVDTTICWSYYSTLAGGLTSVSGPMRIDLSWTGIPLGVYTTHERDYFGVTTTLEALRYLYSGGCWPCGIASSQTTAFGTYNSNTKRSLAISANITAKALNIGAHT